MMGDEVDAAEISWQSRGGEIRVGDVVKVLPSRPRARDGFLAEVRQFKIDEMGEVLEICVVGAPAGRPVAWRTFRPERVAPVRKTRRRMSR